jgi:osmotically-inducible protein OsmY
MSTLADTQLRVQAALQRDMPGSEIQVSVTDDGSLQLTGSVPTSDQKRRAEDIARSTTHNQSIVNKITVRSEPAPDQSAVPR